MLLEEKLGETLLTSAGETIRTSTIANRKTFLLYFSALWCGGPCRVFTPKLNDAYSAYKSKTGDNYETEIVFISWDNSPETFNKHRKEMSSFLAMPFQGNEELRSKLGEKFGVRGIPSLVLLNDKCEVINLEVDPRVLVDMYGAQAFPLSVERVTELQAEAGAKADAALRQLYDDAVSFSIKAADGSTVSLTDLLSSYCHVGLIFSDGDHNDPTYKAIEDSFAQINSTESGKQLQVGVYLAWSLYEGCDHAAFAEKFAEKFHVVLDIPEDLRAVLTAIVGNPNFFGMLNLRRGSGLCSVNGICEADGVPVIVAKDGGFRRVREGGAPAYPWSDAKMQEFAAEEKRRLDELKTRQPNLEFLKSETGEDRLLVRTIRADKPTVAKDLLSLGDAGVVGLYFSSRWCCPCQRFTPMLVECYEKLKEAGKKFEVVVVSSERDKDSFDEYLNGLVTSSGEQLIAVNFEDRQRKRDLGKLFNVQGIPTLILLKPNGELLTHDGTEAISYGHEYFPWDTVSMERGAEAAKAKAAAAAAAAAEQEKENAAAQREAGDVVVVRLNGEPVDVQHDIVAKTVKFNTYCTVGAPEALVTSGVVYYELEVLDNEGGVPQMGFALKDDCKIAYASTGEGCGDNDTSWGLDGTRCVKWFDGEAAEWPCHWATGDVIGLAANVDAGKIAVSKNGNWYEEACGIVFEDERIKTGVYPCLTGGGYSLRYAFKDFKHTVPSRSVWSAKAEALAKALAEAKRSWGFE